MKTPSNDDIVNALKLKGVVKPCPRCGNEGFILLDGLTLHSMQDETGTFVLGGRTVPAILTACQNCGYLSQHALLTLFPPTDKEETQ